MNSARLAWASERMRQMGECAKADYHARFVAHWSYPHARRFA
jgi:hypothetical protein